MTAQLLSPPDGYSEFPEMKGFSRANLLYMRAFAESWQMRQLSNSLLDRSLGDITI